MTSLYTIDTVTHRIHKMYMCCCLYCRASVWNSWSAFLPWLLKHLKRTSKIACRRKRSDSKLSKKLAISYMRLFQSAIMRSDKYNARSFYCTHNSFVYYLEKGVVLITWCDICNVIVMGIILYWYLNSHTRSSALQPFVRFEKWVIRIISICRTKIA